MKLWRVVINKRQCNCSYICKQAQYPCFLIASNKDNHIYSVMPLQYSFCTWLNFQPRLNIIPKIKPCSEWYLGIGIVLLHLGVKHFTSIWSTACVKGCGWPVVSGGGAPYCLSWLQRSEPKGIYIREKWLFLLRACIINKNFCSARKIFWRMW